MKRSVVHVLLAAPFALMASGCGSLGGDKDDQQSRQTGKQQARDYALAVTATQVGEDAGDVQLGRDLVDLHPEADTNDDGILSVGELDQWSRDMVLWDFPEADANEDGKLTDDELEQWSRQQIIESFPTADADRDGRLTDAELDATFGAEDGFITYGASFGIEAVETTEITDHRDLLDMFPDADTDNDGTLSDAELDRLFDGEEITSATAASHELTDADRRQMARDFPEADVDNNGRLSDEEEEAFFSSFDTAITWDGSGTELAVTTEVSHTDW